MGKRVDFSARSVITPDPNIDLDQLGVPIKIALNLTFPEIVNSFNIEELKTYIKNGPDIWPGAKSIIKRDGNRYTINDSNIYLHATILRLSSKLDCCHPRRPRGR